MALTVAQYDALIDAAVQQRAMLLRSVGDENAEKVDFKSDQEHAALIAALRAERAQVAAGSQGVTTIRVHTSKGIYR